MAHSETERPVEKNLGAEGPTLDVPLDSVDASLIRPEILAALDAAEEARSAEVPQDDITVKVVGGGTTIQADVVVGLPQKAKKVTANDVLTGKFKIRGIKNV